MKKMHKLPFNLDEREMNDFRNICTIMYIITLFALMSIQLYRQFVLYQPQQEWNDIAMLMTINVIVLLGAVLYLTGAVNPKKIRRSYLIAGYVGFVLLGFAFTVFKYTVILGQQIGLVQVWDYLLTVILISGVLAFALGILAYLGSRRIDKQIE
jgi:heme/copper-type cytochrome/quinol oxidase subunit 3